MSAAGKRVVVVGGGVIGTACAHYLSLEGWAVTIVERGLVGQGASAGNCGLVCPSHVLPLAEPGAVGRTLGTIFRRNSPLAIRPRLDPALWSWLIRFARRCNETHMMEAGRGISALLGSSLGLYEDLVQREGLECEWERRGLLFAYRSSAALQAYHATDRLLGEAFGVPARRLDGEGLVALEPALTAGLAGGWYYEDDAHLRPDVLMRSWRSALEVRGVVIREGSGLKVFRQSSQGHARAVVTEAGEEIAADAVVVAAGAMTPRLNRVLGMRVPIVPGKGYSLTMPHPAVSPKVPMIFPETRVAVTPFRSGFRLGSTMEFAGYDETIRPRRLQLLRDGSSPYLRGSDRPGSEGVEEAWYGWRPMTHDGLPIIDQAPAHPNVWIAAGHNMLGLSMAPATGKLVAELLGGREPHVDPSPYRVGRFRRGA